MSSIRRLNSSVRSFIAIIAVVTGLAGAIPQTTSARVEYPPGVFTLALSVNVALPGAEIDATITGAVSDVSIDLVVEGTDIAVTAECPAPPSGSSGPTACVAEAEFVAPQQVGSYTAEATEVAGAQRSATAVLDVVNAPTGPTTTTADGGGGSLPSTGSDIWQLMAAGVALAAAGAVAVLITRRRRTPSTAG